MANKYGWNYEDIVQCTVYGTYQRWKANLIEKVNEDGKPDDSVSSRFPFNDAHRR
jgi:hypothetical protein